MKQLKFYLDTSVIGGYFDPEFEKPTQLFIENVKKGIFQTWISEITLYEINKAPEILSTKLL